MTMFCANHATTAASCRRPLAVLARTFSHNIALLLDAARWRPFFVAAAIVSLLGSSALFIIVISIILVTIIALLVTASGRYGEPT